MTLGEGAIVAAAILSLIGVVFVALINRRSNQETKYIESLGKRVTELETQVGNLNELLDTERLEKLEAIAECHRLQASEKALLMQTTQQAAHILELQGVIAALKAQIRRLTKALQTVGRRLSRMRQSADSPLNQRQSGAE